MDRNRAIACIKAAVCEGDMRAATRLYVENRVSYAAFKKAIAEAESLILRLAEKQTSNL